MIKFKQRLSLQILFICFMSIILIGCSNTKNNDFGQILPNVSFGMTKEKIIEKEAKNGNEEYGEIENTVIYNNTYYLGYNANICYEFDDNNQLNCFAAMINTPSKEIYNNLKDIIEKEIGDITDEENDELSDCITWETESGIVNLLYIKKSSISDNSSIAIIIKN